MELNSEDNTCAYLVDLLEEEDDDGSASSSSSSTVEIVAHLQCSSATNSGLGSIAAPIYTCLQHLSAVSRSVVVGMIIVVGMTIMMMMFGISAHVRTRTNGRTECSKCIRLWYLPYGCTENIIPM